MKTRQASPECTPVNQRLGKPDKLSQSAHNQTSYPRVQWENTLDKRGATDPQGREEQQQSLEAGNPVSCEPERGECEVKEQSRT